MIAAWMLYFVAISALLSVAAAVAERALVPGRHARRWLWVAALTLSVVLPPAVHTLSEQGAPRRALVMLAEAAPSGAGTFISESPIEWVTSTPVDRSSMSGNRWLMLAWTTTSVLLFALYAASWLQMRRRLRESRTVVMDEVSLTVTDDVGPAVIGFTRPRIVVPGWLLSADASMRSIALAHEREHLCAHDAQLFGAALVLVTLLPWNLPLWWQLRRLRFAIEVDCDARVLRAGGDPVVYGNVLLDVAARLSGALMPGVALSESGSLLEKRIRLMKRAAEQPWRIVSILLGSCAFGLVAAAAGVAPPARVPTFAGDVSNGSGSIRLPSPLSEQQSADRMVATAVAHFYPQLADRKQDGAPRVWAVINQKGEIAATSLELSPFWSDRSLSNADWSEHLRQFGMTEADATHRIQIETKVGPNNVDVAWVMRPGAVALDSSAPRIGDSPPGAPSTQELLATTETQRVAIAQYDQDAIASGLPAGDELWFLMDADGNVLRAGRRSVLADPQAARTDLQTKFPGIRVGYVTRGTAVKDSNGRRIAVSWQWLEQGSPLPR